MWSYRLHAGRRASPVMARADRGCREDGATCLFDDAANRVRKDEKLVEGPAVWVSMCSMHGTEGRGDTTCPRCKLGYWTGEHDIKREQEEFKRDPAAWRRKMNP